MHKYASLIYMLKCSWRNKLEICFVKERKGVKSSLKEELIHVFYIYMGRYNCFDERKFHRVQLKEESNCFILKCQCFWYMDIISSALKKTYDGQ